MADWITKKEKPKSWITKKEKRTPWITKKKKPTEWIKRKPPTDIRKKLTDAFAGGVKGKPHSSPEGQAASVGRTIKRIAKGGRAEYGLGSIVKKVITKIKPKGVFKPKPVPKKVTDKPTGWSPKGSYTKADEKKIDSLLYKLGDEIKAQPLPPKLKKTIKKLQKAYPHHDSAGRNKASKKVFKSAQGKAAGGRIGLKHGGSAGAAVRGHGAEIK